MVMPIPDGYHSVTPYLYIRGAARAIDFYTRAFGAKEVFRIEGPDGTVGHAELKIGSSIIMLADESSAASANSPDTLGGTTIGLLLYVDDVDRVFHQAVAAGATATRPLADQFYGDRTGGVRDPFGHNWYLATHIEDVSPEEMQRRAQKQGA